MNGHHDGPENEQVGAYVLDALPPDEVMAFEEHLESCASCRDEVAELRDVVDVLPLAVDLVEPAPSVRDRIVSAVEAETNGRPALTALQGGVPVRAKRRRIGMVEGLLALAAVAVIAALGIWNVLLQQKIDRQQAEVAFQRDVTTALTHHAAVYPVAPTPADSGASAYMVQPRGKAAAYLIVKDLPASARGTVYQLWLIRGGTPRSAGTFTYTGSDPKIVRAPIPASGYTLTAVTIEHGPHGSAHGPTGAKVLVGTLG
ncbi:MAG TPA: anti-sigma factor [Chloroflexota bacterium]